VNAGEIALLDRRRRRREPMNPGRQHYDAVDVKCADPLAREVLAASERLDETDRAEQAHHLLAALRLARQGHGQQRIADHRAQRRPTIIGNDPSRCVARTIRLGCPRPCLEQLQRLVAIDLALAVVERAGKRDELIEIGVARIAELRRHRLLARQKGHGPLRELAAGPRVLVRRRM
jgi:hypothetical protein